MRHCLLALAAALGLAAAPALGSTLSEVERAELHAEIRAYLLENPEIIMEMVAILEGRQAEDAARSEADAIAAHRSALHDDGFSHVGGNPDGSVTLVEFIDYGCGFCRRAHPEISAMVAEDGDIRLVVKELPILGPGSEFAARAAIATLILKGGTAYEAVKDGLMRLDGPLSPEGVEGVLADQGIDTDAVRAEMGSDEVTRRLQETRALAQALSISGTPTYVLEDQLIRGYLPRAQMEELVALVRPEE